MTAPSAPRPPVTVRMFRQRFSSTPFGARLARHLVAVQLDVWGIPHGSALSDTAAVIVGELAANAVTHGRVPGRDFEVCLVHTPDVPLRIEVSDSRGECRPPGVDRLVPPAPLGEAGRGLVLVAALADRWGVRDRPAGPGKTVWAEVGPDAG
ncbi:ATP-binding protein [Streptomyces tagetis]|uniref:ATP-binding protein n=1 Tax=Streptomyces tagetis TaxID=2820809 RepID=A0A940XJG5_9ACTN|nr:ATP-binding protein [Streptomyces sp. RG38]MBQ0825755.1 ATP-binding protein [Streptomyces sp. RG38]